MSLALQPDKEPHRAFDSAEMGALAHLYRGEVYRSTIWRTRLDNTTNWSIVTMGIALSSSFSSPEASPLPLILVGLLVAVFLTFEARRYRYFNVWRARARWMETNFYAPLLRGEAQPAYWRDVLAKDYTHPRHHITLWQAMGRRLRRNYSWILAIQTTAYLGKIIIHPTPAAHFGEVVARAAIGPIPGWVVLAAGAAYNGVWLAFGLWSLSHDRAKHGDAGKKVAMG
ncbi:MAG TPA: DUF2270 domain-containing protein [Rhodoblastus sp.]|nr:DUF2270 domain-containing protein [Rhodoblastus sp.]